MRLYYFLVPFHSAQEGPQIELTSPFDKFEIEQGDRTAYPPAPEDHCIVSVQCQQHTMIEDATLDTTDPEPLIERERALMPIETDMAAAIEQMKARYTYLGVERYA